MRMSIYAQRSTLFFAKGKKQHSYVVHHQRSFISKSELPVVYYSLIFSLLYLLLYCDCAECCRKNELNDLYRKYHLIRPNIQNISSLDICFLQCHLLISNSCCCAILQIFFICQSFCLLIYQSYCLFVCLSIYLPPYLLITSLL